MAKSKFELKTPKGTKDCMRLHASLYTVTHARHDVN